MSKTPSHSPRSAAPSIRQRLVAAHRLAAGDPPSLAAALASLDVSCMADMHADNDEMGHLVAACAGVQHLEHDAWLIRLAEQVRMAIELAVVDGNTTVVMGAARALVMLRPVALGPYDGPDGDLRRFIDNMSDQEYAEFVALGFQDVGETDEQASTPTSESATVLPFRRPREPSDESTS